MMKETVVVLWKFLFCDVKSGRFPGGTTARPTRARSWLLALTLFSAWAVTAAEEESFATKCTGMLEQSGRGGTICSCVGEGLGETGNGDEILAVMAKPRGERREAMRAMSEGSRRVLMSCMRGMRGDPPRRGE